MAATYTVKQVAKILGYSTNSIYTFLKEKRIKGVRVGRGRFRVPEAELARLLQISKTDTQTLAPESESKEIITKDSEGITEPLHDVISGTLIDGANQATVPSVFDWFISIGATLLGSAMFLFNRFYEEFAVSQYLPWLLPLKITFIAAGLGLLFTDMAGVKQRKWHVFFHICLIGAFMIQTWLMSEVGNGDGVVVYGAAAVTLGLSVVFSLGGIASMALYQGLLVLFLPLVMLMGTSRLPELLEPFASVFPGFGAYAVVGGGSLLLVAICVWGYFASRKIFWIVTSLVNIVFIGVAIHMAQELAWGRALFLLMLSMVGLFLPLWESFDFREKRDRMVIFTAFGVTLLLFLGVLGVNRVLQTNMIEYSERELGNKVAYAKTLIESIVDTSQSTLESAGLNRVLVDELSKKEPSRETLLGFTRTIFESRRSYSRVMIVGVGGQMVTLYPFDAQFDGSRIGALPEIAQAITGKKTIVSQLSVDSKQIPSVNVLVPVIGSDREVLGVLIGVLDMTGLDTRLQELATPNSGETITLIDASGTRLVDPDTRLIGTQVPKESALRNAFTRGEQSVSEEYNEQGIRSLLAYSPVGASRWAVGISVPIAQVVQITRSAGMSVIVVSFLSVVMWSIFLIIRRPKHNVPKGGGP